MEKTAEARLAILGGPKARRSDPRDIFRWPIITEEDEEAALEVLRRGAMSGTDVTEKFEEEFAAWHGVRYALAFNNGTAALHSAMWACGVRAGDEVIGPSLTYWASLLPALNLGATVVFAEARPDTLCIDPSDIERRVTPRTRAIVVVHYCGHPCDMDPILEIARPRGIKVIEDVSHAHGGLYKGRPVGTIGDAGAMSLMTGKSLAIGEGGMLITNDRGIFERAVAFGHYERTGKPTRYSNAACAVTDPALRRFAGVPLGGFKYRMHQISSAVGRVQLRHYRRRMEEIQKAMNLFWDLLEGVPGIRPIRPPEGSGSTMGGWYYPHGIYVPEELGGLPAARFCEAVRAEGVETQPGANAPLHLHPFFREADVYGHGRPANFASRDPCQGPGSLPVTEMIPDRCFSVPWFKHFRPEVIAEYAAAFRKVAEHADELLSAGT
ncbi:MAG: DegT/DnrJ/EryC1/StrS family aminotransferase [Planctomycetota bacterium]|nr:DegT/DnrJ/EryC1/StrS family aminotransferase [Planctomycetota bacterium]